MAIGVGQLAGFRAPFSDPYVGGERRSCSKSATFFDRHETVPPNAGSLLTGTDDRGRAGRLSVGNQGEKAESGGLLRPLENRGLAETESAEFSQ